MNKQAALKHRITLKKLQKLMKEIDDEGFFSIDPGRFVFEYVLESLEIDDETIEKLLSPWPYGRR
jgi:hypothetical protein